MIGSLLGFIRSYSTKTQEEIKLFWERFNDDLRSFKTLELNRLIKILNDLTEEECGLFCDNFFAVRAIEKQHGHEQIIKVVREVLKSNPSKALKILNVYLDNNVFSNLISDLISREYDFIPLVCDYVSKAPLDRRFNLYIELIKSSISKDNVLLLLELKKDEALYQSALTSLRLSEDMKLKLAQIENVSDPDFYTRTMLQFTSGFGRIKHEGGLLAIAQIAHNKARSGKKEPYSFNPTLIEENDFEAYLTLLKNAAPVKEKFIVTGFHWVCGEISIDDKGEVKFLLIDSLGVNPNDFGGAQIIDEYPLLKILAKSFSSDDYNLKIYTDDIKRQNAMYGCSAFALDDITHLHIIEKHLSAPDSGSQTIFDYLEKSTRTVLHETDENNHTVAFHMSYLPLSLMRTMQSTQFTEDKIREGVIHPSVLSLHAPEIQALPINKRGLTAKESFEEHLVEEGGVKQNKRLNHKLNRLAYKNREYALTTSPEEIKKAMSQFTLESLYNRLVHMRSSPLLFSLASTSSPSASASVFPSACSSAFASIPPSASSSATLSEGEVVSTSQDEKPKAKKPD